MVFQLSSIEHSKISYPLFWPIKNNAKKAEKMNETLAHVYSSESTERELSNEYLYDGV